MRRLKKRRKLGFSQKGCRKSKNKGTRIPVVLIIRKLGEGAVLEDLLDAYPNLEKDDIQAALLYAADHMGNETVIYLKTGT